jgi:hypothetical protein
MSFAKCAVCDKVGKWERVKYDLPAYCPDHMSAEDKQKIEDNKQASIESVRKHAERDAERLKKFQDEGGAQVLLFDCFAFSVLLESIYSTDYFANN